MNIELSSNFNFCLSNIFIFHFINDNIKNTTNLEEYGMYIKFFNHPENDVPASFLENREVTIYLHKKFENFAIDFLYLFVTLSVDNRPVNVKINLFTIMDVRLGKVGLVYNITLAYRVTNEYSNMISHIDTKTYINTVQSILKAWRDLPANIYRFENKEEKVRNTNFINFEKIKEDE